MALPVTGSSGTTADASIEELELDLLLEGIYRRYGYDFRGYAGATLRRRLWKRMTLERLPTGTVYANPGSWLDAPTFLRLTTERIELRRWDGSAEGLHLDALDRVSEKALT